MNRDSLLDVIRKPGAALLDGWSDSGRWTIALADPLDELRVEWGEEARLEDFLRTVPFRTKSRPETREVPFLGGWVGFISYEVGSRWEGAPRVVSDLPEPAALFFRHESGIAISPEGEAYRFERGETRRLEAKGPSRSNLTPGLQPPPLQLERGTGGEVTDSLGGPAYARAHEEIRRGIARGDYYQVNLTRRFSRPAPGRADPRALFRGLAGPEPPPYSALILGGGFDVISASPELFLRADGPARRVETRPIKGTAPRAEDPAEDARSAEGLRGSAKDRAENVMIVDLCRNDLGRVCEPGSVRVRDLCAVRSHRLHHLESTVEGRLKPGATPADVFRAAFPPGSVTGAPKRAAVAAIARLEPVARGVYTGAVGFLDDRGRFAFNVGIRTAVSTDREVRYHAGGGITWDSVAELERRESEWKAREFFALAASPRRE